MSLIPRLVSPPGGFPIGIDAMKAHLRIDHDDESAEILGLMAAAVGYLDGWRGVLGRAIMEQSWAVDVPCGGVVTLPMPDVVSAEVEYEDSVAPSALEVVVCARGPQVELTEPGTVTFTCRMGLAQRDVAIVVIKMLVGHWFETRSAVSVGSGHVSVPMAADMLIAGLRWKSI